ncbi:unnamed protein product, partial [Choristocarpus tenellus]
MVSHRGGILNLYSFVAIWLGLSHVIVAAFAPHTCPTLRCGVRVWRYHVRSLKADQTRPQLPIGDAPDAYRNSALSLRAGLLSTHSLISSSASDIDLKREIEPFLPPERRRLSFPGDSLSRGEWFKLICGASFEDLPAVRNLAIVFTLAGADCIDVAAEEAVIEAVRDGIHAAMVLASSMSVAFREPWLMVSVNDDEEDPHFRKAQFNPALCPPDCPRPCESVCPADAVVFPD